MYSAIQKLGLLVVLFWPAAIVVSGQTTRPLDAFFDPAKNETTVYLSQKYMRLSTYQPEGFVPPDTGEYMLKPEGLVLTVFFKTPGNKPDVPRAIKLGFESRSSGDFRYANDLKLVIKADDLIFDLGQMTRVKTLLDRSSRGMGGAYYEEDLEAGVGLEDYTRIVNAKRVQMMVGKTKVRLSEKYLRELRIYLERLKS